MKPFTLNRNLAQLALLQRIELADLKLKKIRKLFGRYLFSKIFSKYLIDVKQLSENYTNIMNKEFKTIQSFIKDKRNFLSIGAGIGGLELLILKSINEANISFIEKNYISNKIRYGWDNSNKEGYNDLNQLDQFLQINEIPKKRYQIFDFDEQKFPIHDFDVLISIYSLDYHYSFDIYSAYLKKVMKNNSLLIFDTIRPEYFKRIFKYVEIIKEDTNTVHKSKRIVCKNYL